jgi:thioredoxin-dependent peroxiredoxin
LNKTKSTGEFPQTAGVAVGETVPDFTVMSSSGNPVTLSSLKGQKVILYFYPKDDTPGCTLEGQEFNKHLKEFADANTKVFGVSRDSVESHCKFIDKYGYKFELLSDTDEKLCKMFDVIKEKNMYGKISMGIVRSTFVIDENQKLMFEFRKVSPPGHAEEMLQLVKGH